MLSPADAALLLRAMRGNSAVLFLGAGFSSEARNSLDLNLPVGSQLAAGLWMWLGYEAKHGGYNGTTLDRLFDVARKTRGDAELTRFLEDRLRVATYPAWYRNVAYPYWHRIYTTNVDDLIERVYRETGTARLDVVNGVRERSRDRDAYLEHVQYIKLNGSLGPLDSLTFGTRQFGKRASDLGVWYDQFVRDYSTHTTVLVGTKVNEPLFWQALELRQGRNGAAQELRLRSFLVSKDIDPVVLDSLAEFNVVPVDSDAGAFFEYLSNQLGDYPSRESMLMSVDPRRAQYLSTGAKTDADSSAAKAFFDAFSRVTVADAPLSHHSLYHHGATPDWQDLALGLDAQRDITAEAQALFESALDGPAMRRFVVTGHRGAGKSTLLMRTALNLSAAGHLVFFGVGEDVPEPELVARATGLFGRRVALVVDDAEWVAGRAAEYVRALEATKYPPVLILGIRANSLHGLGAIPKGDELWIGDLTDDDIEALIAVLKRANSLGTMAGATLDSIRRAFKDRAKKQILVAMREVTTGRQFDEIIKTEFHDIVDPELRLAYLVACLATAAGTSLTRGQLLSCSELAHAVLLSAVNRELRQVVVYADQYGDRVIARHPFVATMVIEKAAGRVMLSDAYKRILAVLANDMDPRAKSGEPKRSFRLYKRLVSHRELFERFEKSIDEARSIFDALTPRLSEDAHFWLQYGSLELEYGELDLAARYIATAESLAPHHWIVRNTKGHLLFRMAIGAQTKHEASALRRDAEAILEAMIVEQGDDSDYPWHILISHTADWIEIWEQDATQKRAELEVLNTRATEACEARPFSDDLKAVKGKVERAYLSVATKKS
jgi:hypothetical protein